MRRFVGPIPEASVDQVVRSRIERIGSELPAEVPLLSSTYIPLGRIVLGDYTPEEVVIGGDKFQANTVVLNTATTLILTEFGVLEDTQPTEIKNQPGDKWTKKTYLPTRSPVELLPGTQIIAEVYTDELVAKEATFSLVIPPRIKLF